MLRRLIKLLGGRKGGATRGGKGGSHVHKSGKRQANKAIRKNTTCQDPPFTCMPPWCDHCNKYGEREFEEISTTIFTDMAADLADDLFITDLDPEEGDRRCITQQFVQ